MAEEIIVTVKGGKTTVETRGFVGTACKDATKDLERALGMTVRDENTPEFHQREVRTISN